MWQIHYLEALDLAREREREAQRHRLTRQLPAKTPRPWFDDVRRAGALAVDRLGRRRPASAT